MLAKIAYRKILFLDIETVPEAANWADISLDTQKLWELKTQYQRIEGASAEDYYPQRASIMAEFGKIICISVGVVINDKYFKAKSFYGDDEQKILKDFSQLLASDYYKDDHILCAHNGKEFDFPYIARRMIINQIQLPNSLNSHGKKPWEINHLDTLELWKFGDYKHYTSLNLLAHVLGIPTPKDDIDGSQVAYVYYEEKNINRIKNYCEKDVFTVAQILRKMRYDPLLEWQKTDFNPDNTII